MGHKSFLLLLFLAYFTIMLQFVCATDGDETINGWNKTFANGGGVLSVAID